MQPACPAGGRQLQPLRRRHGVADADHVAAAGIDRLSAVPVYEFDRSFVDEIAGLIERRSTLSISVTERELYLEIGGRTFTATIVEHRA